MLSYGRSAIKSLELAVDSADRTLFFGPKSSETNSSGQDQFHVYIRQIILTILELIWRKIHSPVIQVMTVPKRSMNGEDLIQKLKNAMKSIPMTRIRSLIYLYNDYVVYFSTANKSVKILFQLFKPYHLVAIFSIPRGQIG